MINFEHLYVEVSYHELQNKDVIESRNFLWHCFRMLGRHRVASGGDNLIMMFKSDFDSMIRMLKNDNSHTSL